MSTHRMDLANQVEQSRKVKRLEARCSRYRAALTRIACFEQGDLSGSMDEPHAAAIAREALKEA
jgi:hypothetical protein